MMYELYEGGGCVLSRLSTSIFTQGRKLLTPTAGQGVGCVGRGCWMLSGILLSLLSLLDNINLARLQIGEAGH